MRAGNSFCHLMGVKQPGVTAVRAKDNKALTILNIQKDRPHITSQEWEEDKLDTETNKPKISTEPIKNPNRYIILIARTFLTKLTAALKPTKSAPFPVIFGLAAIDEYCLAKGGTLSS